MTRHEQPRLIVDPRSRVIEPKGTYRNSLTSKHVGVQHVSVFPDNQDHPYTRYSYHGLVVGDCVHVAAYTPGEEFIFVEEQRPLATTRGIEVRTFLGFPGGFADGNTKNLAEEAARELTEEAGITVYDSLFGTGDQYLLHGTARRTKSVIFRVAFVWHCVVGYDHVRKVISYARLSRRRQNHYGTHPQRAHRGGAFVF